MEDAVQLRMVNARFYEAFERGDLEGLDDIWAHDEQVMCVHPGWEAITGWGAIRQSWERIFAGGVGMKFSLRNVTARVVGPVGIVMLTEEIVLVEQSVSQTVQAAATNVFTRVDGEWKLIVHHGSPVMAAKEDDADFRYN